MNLQQHLVRAGQGSRTDDGLVMIDPAILIQAEESIAELKSAVERLEMMLKNSLAGRPVICADEGLMEAQVALMNLDKTR